VDCEMTSSELVPYLFGVIADDPRSGVEEHLLGCSSCLRDFIALKRAAETADAEPSPGARGRLRHAVATELRSRAPRATWSWWERPLALGLAGAVVMIAMMAVHRLSSSPGAPPRTISPSSMPSG
jgi:predicted anti-sigma-YlaC factor YlaD